MTIMIIIIFVPFSKLSEDQTACTIATSHSLKTLLIVILFCSIYLLLRWSAIPRVPHPQGLPSLVLGVILGGEGEAKGKGE